jgi:hypothetical protein
MSCLLTINLTASTSFTTRKESGVLAPNFSELDDDANKAPAFAHVAEPAKRKVMYYVRPGSFSPFPSCDQTICRQPEVVYQK